MGDLVELSRLDGGGGTVDAAGTDDMGQTQAAVFDPDIQMDLVRLGCTAQGCHGGTQVPILKDAPDQATKTANYNNFKADAMMGEMSLVLTKTVKDGVVHGAGDYFQSTADPTYQKWLAWINAGHPEK